MSFAALCASYMLTDSMLQYDSRMSVTISARITDVVPSAARQAFGPMAIPDEPYEGEIEFLHNVANMMGRLQLHQPLLRAPNIADQTDPGNWDGSEPVPSPTVSQWTDIQTVASRLFVTLKWVSTKAAASEVHDDKRRLLRETLVVLLARLLLPHLKDNNLNMQELFR